MTDIHPTTYLRAGQVKLRLGLPSEDSMAGLAEEAAADARLLHTHELNITHYASQVRIGQRLRRI